MAAIIGALRVVLGADTAALDKGLKDAQGSLKGFAAAAATIAAGIGLEKLVEKAANAFTHAVKQGFEAADQLGKSAQKIGIPVEELSKLQYAAELSGVSMGALEKGVGKLSQTIAQAAGGAANDATRAFTAMGISVKDAQGNIRPTTQIIEDLSAKFDTMKDGAGKTALAMSLFGKSGKDLIPLLNEGRDGLARMFDEAEKLGLVISQKTVAATTHFNDDMKTLSKVSQGVATLVTAELAPAFAVLAANIKKSVVEGNVVQTIAQAITDTMISTVSVVARLGLTFVRMSEEISGAVAILKSLLSLDGGEGFRKGWDLLTEAGRKYHEQVANIDTGLKKFLSDAGAKANEWAGENKKRTEEAATGVEKHKTALDNFLASQEKSIAGKQADIATEGLAAGSKERLRVVLQGLTIAQQGNTVVSEAQRAAITAMGNAAGNAAIQLEGTRLVFANLDPLTKYQIEMSNTEQAMRSVGATAETIARAQTGVAEKFGMAWSSIGSNIANTAGALSQLTGTFAKENKTMGTLSKAFGIGQAIINTQIAITKALATLPPPASYAAVAFAIAQGAAAVASIGAQKFATGGSFSVGGTGGVDSTMVPMMVTPGERVTVDQNKYGESSGGATKVVNINMPSDYVPRDAARAMVRTIQELVGDGLRVNFSPA